MNLEKIHLFLVVLLCISHSALSQTNHEIQNKSEQLSLLLLKSLNKVGNDANNSSDSNFIKLIKILESGILTTVSSVSKGFYSDDMTLNKIMENDCKILQSINWQIDSSDAKRKLEYLNKKFALLSLTFTQPGFYTIPYFNIEVKIRVTKHNKDIHGYDIGCSTLFWFDSRPAKFANDNKSPTIITLPPGDYIFTLFRNNTTIKSFRRSIGSAKGETLQEIQFELE